MLESEHLRSLKIDAGFAITSVCFIWHWLIALGAAFSTGLTVVATS